MQLGAQATKMQGTIEAGDVDAVFSATLPLEMHVLIYSLVGSLEVTQNFVFSIGGHFESIPSRRDREEGVHPIA